MPIDNPLYLCSVCGKDFAGLRYFDRHRVGTHEYDFSADRPDGRRCLDTAEIEALGFQIDPRERWGDPTASDRMHNVHRGATVDAHRTPETPSEATNDRRAA